MAQAMVLDGRETLTQAKAPAVFHAMPLSFMKSGEVARIAKVRGKGELHHHLENLGFVEGATVSVVCENAGNFIVEVKGAQVAIDRTVAQKIITA